MNPEQQKAYEWAKNQNYQSVAAQYAKILADLIYSLQADLARVTAERDAAVSDLYTACKTSPCNNGVCVSRNCMGDVMPCNFEWRGVKGEQE